MKTPEGGSGSFSKANSVIHQDTREIQTESYQQCRELRFFEKGERCGERQTPENEKRNRRTQERHSFGAE